MFAIEMTDHPIRIAIVLHMFSALHTPDFVALHTSFGLQLTHPEKFPLRRSVISGLFGSDEVILFSIFQHILQLWLLHDLSGDSS